MEFIIFYYAGIAFVLMVYMCNWHYRNQSTMWPIVHDALMAWLWPLIVIERVWQVHTERQETED